MSWGERRMLTVWRTMPGVGLWRYTYADYADRVCRLSAALAKLGLTKGGGEPADAVGVVGIGVAPEPDAGHPRGHGLPVEDLPRPLEELRERERVVHDEALHAHRIALPRMSSVWHGGLFAQALIGWLYRE